MTQSIRQQRDLRVAIGSKYDGPQFDRPALRKLPAGWTLDDPDKPQPGDRAVCWICWAVFVFAVVEAVIGVLAK